ncbi:Asp-tRNA(Asn)/Glu-tRNA(Gln) amidotransferase subunit GatC [Lactococcus allomyrinae]|uniref:Aspartyl/glutamyl-tRNA(Asn/Gln) amidotransferase subunit C n=1 Tax=Lactococcus allomyrinae TaxID=2419773 RepID=A0A387BCB6_9LACT|nr:Asp-tRNA(Asn)/Glu-tRNA(Gln) amidotransferase subunit GatC [Lactococcus allomyrinae]AYG01515.1 Asp-tRNA(Asn)/Glu-tRNA(Gln) amidotransferase subunit GatC [Lactococcus allomyrinae]
MSQITEEQVKHVALLSKLEFSEEEVSDFTATFGKIIDMVEMLDEVDTAGISFTMNVADNLNFMREDVAEEGVDRDKLMAAVPEKQDGFIKVPAMLSDGGDA